MRCWSRWPIFHGWMILPYSLKTIWCMNIILLDYESVWPGFWPKINVGHCELYFMVHWVYLISWRLFEAWMSYFRIVSQYDILFDLKINVGHCDLYFMAHWFCLISWRLFDVWTSYFGIMSRYNPTFDLEINVVSWSSDFALYLEDNWMYKHHTLGLRVSMIWRLTSK